MTSRDAHNLPLAQPLTPREQEILDCLGNQLSNRQIAEKEVIALSTVKWHVRQIFNKLGVNSRGEAVVRARSLGLLPGKEQERTVRNNLPLAVTPFVGRERELSAIATLIADPQVRIITIVGPGGIGKSRLALEAAGREMRQQSDFADGIFFVSLAPLDSVAEIVTTLAVALDFQFQDATQGSGSETEQILTYLAQKQILLLMDNFEHLLDGRALLTEIMSRAPGIKLLITSRERLQLRGEQLFPLQGLKVAQSVDAADDDAAGYAAAQLFLNISRRSLPDFELLPGDAEPLLRVCRLVEGMPLGLELAASWAGHLPLSSIADEIERSLQILTTGFHDVPERHRSMQATLDLSWRRLTSEQRLGLQKLTVFRGGFTRRAALEAAGATLPTLVSLVNKSWLSYDRQRNRYDIHELLRQYGAAKLSADNAREQKILGKHAAYFCNFLKEREASLFGAGQQQAVSEVRRDIDNIQIAWRWAAEKGDGVLLDRGLNSLCRFYLWESRLEDGLYACRAARSGLSNLPAEQQSDDEQLQVLLSQILSWESEFTNKLGNKERLLDQSQDILDHLAAAGRDIRREQASLFLRKAYAAEFRDYADAIRFANLGLNLYKELDDDRGVGEASGRLGFDYLFLGAYDRAQELLRDSLAIKRQLGDAAGIAESMGMLGHVATHQGRFAEAEALHRQSLKLFQELGSRHKEVSCLRGLAYSLSFAGQYLVARETAEDALELEREFGLYPNPMTLNPFIKATIHLGNYDEASTRASECLAIARQRGLLRDTNWALLWMGNIALVEGNLDRATCHLQESITGLEQLKHIYLAIPRAILSCVARAQGHGELAGEYLRAALRSGLAKRATAPIMYCLPAAALLAADAGQPGRAIELYHLAQRYGHVKNSLWFEAIACRELDGVIASVPPEFAAVAQSRSRELDIWETAESLLAEAQASH